jgi:hypothetical protein
MTRANLNFISQNIGERPRTLYYYQNGDQYPTGLRDFYKVLDWLKFGAFSKEGFNNWIEANYSNGDQARPREITHPAVFYNTSGFITDYSYVFDQSINRITVYEWDKKIFSGSVERFIKWLEGRKK